jgi:Transcriptional regulatory protein, C terminal
MTAVAMTMTSAQAPAGLQATAEPGLALYVGLDPDAGPADRALLVDLARTMADVITEFTPDATTHTALTLGGRGPHGQLVARVREQLAAADAGPDLSGRTAPPRRQVMVDPVAREVTIDGQSVAFTYKEFALLEYLLRSPHRAVSREELLTSVWHKREWRSDTRTIDVHVRRLREKLGGCPRIVTIRGVGYRCDPTPEVVLVGSGDAD